MVCSTACNDENFIESCHIFSSPIQLIKDSCLTVFRNMCTKCITNSLRLIMNFFQHKVFITAFFCCFRIPVNVKYFFINWITFTVKYRYSIASNDSHFTIAQDVCITCVVNNSWNIGSNEVFPFAEADNQRVFFLCTNDFIRFIGTDDFESIRTVYTIQHTTNSTDKIAIVHVLQQMCNHLCIRFRFEMISFCDEFLF